MSNTLKILVVDDSAFMRLLISDMLSEDSSIEVIGTAINGLEAKEKVMELHPDLIILDLNMEEYDGLYAVKSIMEECPTPILILSSVGNTNLQPVFEALKNGAVDYMNKPNRNKSKMRDIRSELVQKVKSAARAKPKKIVDQKPETQLKVTSFRKKSKYDIIAIGASTGGPTALERILTILPSDFNIPVIICQHMPRAFIPPFVQRLNSLTKLDVVEAVRNMEPKPGTIMFCPGHSNLILKKEDDVAKVDFTDRVFREYNNPSINAMMKSIATVYADKSVGIILTGMGKDGVEGMKSLKTQGAFTIAQNKASSVIYGMPKAAVESGAIDLELDIKEIGNYLLKKL
ncbi:MAG: chemotaxis-specific protein-glutamate methyltransferase CheB [Ekhidna sp.]|nr:chemotaxis-specific protein-glutamate methyltransferase CheB [Ekhidna sp.]